MATTDSTLTGKFLSSVNEMQGEFIGKKPEYGPGVLIQQFAFKSRKNLIR
jgi:hypothetical protein